MLKKICWYLWNFIRAFDQLFNALLGGWSDMTFSARCWVWRLDYYESKNVKLFILSRLCYIIDFIFFLFEKNHCEKSFEAEKNREHFPERLR